MFKQTHGRAVAPSSQLSRRKFLQAATAGTAALATSVPTSARATESTWPATNAEGSIPVETESSGDDAKRIYRGDRLNYIAFPLGGLGAGMVCLEGTGALTKFSLRHNPDLTSEAPVFAAISVKGREFSRVLEGPVPPHKRFPNFSEKSQLEVQALWGLPRFREATFEARFPFANLRLFDPDCPLDCGITGWSPFEPGVEDDASLPVAGLEYNFTNRGSSPLEAVFSFNAGNFMPGWGQGHIRSVGGGFILEGMIDDRPWTQGSFAVSTNDPAVKINHAWFRGLWIPIVWKDIAEGACYERPPVNEAEGGPAPGASLFVPFGLGPGESKTIVVQLGWHVPNSNLRTSGGGAPDSEWVKQHQTYQPPNGEECYRPWYAARYANIEAVMADWRTRYAGLRAASQRFSEALFNSTLPPEAIEAVTANLSILKSPTVLRQTDGRFWAWEGSADDVGSCDGSCTHVWNYAQALPHLFPRLERSLRETEFGPSQNIQGHQAFRSAMPIRPAPHDFIAAADGQLGGIIKVYREWRISGDTGWLRSIWPKVRKSLDYCIRTWDPRERGLIEEPHHNTYDSELWGPDGMCTSIYVGALQAATLMGAALGDHVTRYDRLLKRGRQHLENDLFDGEYFPQQVKLNGLSARFPEDFGKGGFKRVLSPDELAIAAREGPANQYGAGCLSDGIVGAWMSWAAGMTSPFDEHKVVSHLRSVHRYNFKADLTAHPDPTFAAFRATYALGSDAGLTLCSWPKGGKLSLPFPYASEVWTGIEYQVASHLIAHGEVDKGLEIVRAARKRYDGVARNPFSEVEAGHWYARAMASYALLQAFSGARYDAVERVLYLRPQMKGDFRSFLATATGYGVVGIKDGEPFLDIVSGKIPFERIDYVPRPVQVP